MKTIGGTIGIQQLAQLAGDHDAARMRHFHALDHEAQAAAIRRMAGLGWSDHGIASATKLSVEMVRRLLGERQEPTA